MFSGTLSAVGYRAVCCVQNEKIRDVCKKNKIKKKTHTRPITRESTVQQQHYCGDEGGGGGPYLQTRSRLPVHRTDADDWTAGKRDGSPEVAQCDRDVRSQTTGARGMIEFPVRSRRRDSMIREFMYDSNGPKNRRKKR